LRLFFREQELSAATGFFYRYRGGIFLITNWHNVSGRDRNTLQPISPLAGVPDRMKVLIGCRGHIGEWGEMDVPLYKDLNTADQGSDPVWLEHCVHGNKTDVVAIPMMIPDWAEVHTIDIVNTVPDMLLRISADVFVLGYPRGISGGRGFPICKRANIATEPEIDLDGPRLLIDTATREGMSGAPVIAIADGEFNVEGRAGRIWRGGRVYRFVGVYSGRLGKGEIEAQLGVVWKARVIEEILQIPTVGKNSFLLHAIEAKDSAEDGA
jgi:hypothetical protein